MSPLVIGLLGAGWLVGFLLVWAVIYGGSPEVLL